MIDATRYSLTAKERIVIERMLERISNEPTVEQIHQLIDEAWRICGCDNAHPRPEQLAVFYRDPVWLLNGMFIEQHDISMRHRRAIAGAVARLAPSRVADFGGGFGTLARLLASAHPECHIDICEPYPPRHGRESCLLYPRISFTTKLFSDYYDVLISTDVLEHVEDPLRCLASMVDSVHLGGHLFIANCFYPVVACHLPSTFHLRYTFDDFCAALGLEKVGQCAKSHATVYRRRQVLDPDWPRLRTMERSSKWRFPWRRWYEQNLHPWNRRMRTTAIEPGYYPRKLLKALGWHR